MGTEHVAVGIHDADRGISGVLGEIVAAEGYRPVEISPDAPPDDASLAAMRGLLIDFAPLRAGREDARSLINQLRQRAAPRPLPAIGLTADIDLMRRGGSRFQDLADFALLGKPFALDELVDLLHEMLRPGERRTRAAPQGDAVPAMLYADETGRYTGANKAALSVLGYTLSELRRLRVSDVMAATERVTKQEWSRYRREGRWSADAVPLYRKDGKPVLARVHASLIQGSGKRGPVHVAWIRPRESDSEATAPGSQVEGRSPAGSTVRQ